VTVIPVWYAAQARRFLKKTDLATRRRIVKKIETLKETPVGHDSKRVGGYGEKLFRVRVGRFRILYELDSNHAIGIVKIDKRERVY